MSREERLGALYRAFNARDIEAVLAALADGVHWPNAWEGGGLVGHAAVRDYWRRQWQEIDPIVTPVAVEERSDGAVAVRVHQVVRALDGTILSEGDVVHVYRFDGQLI